MRDTGRMSTAVKHDESWIPPNVFGSRLAQIRNYRKWNLKEAALACGIAEASWREWELSGRRPQGYEEICQKISDRTGCDLIWLMLGRTDYPGQGGDQVSEMSRVQSSEEAPRKLVLVASQ